MSNLDTVQSLYEAFGRGDIPTILGHLADDVAWHQFDDNTAIAAGVPWLAPRTGVAGATEFFTAIGGRDLEVTDFQVLALLDGGDKVAAECVVEAKVPGTDRGYRDEIVHLWSFNDAGQVTRYRQYVDTAKETAAYTG